MDGKARKLCRQKCIKPSNSWKFGVKRALLGQIYNVIKYLYNIQFIQYSISSNNWPKLWRNDNVRTVHVLCQDFGGKSKKMAVYNLGLREFTFWMYALIQTNHQKMVFWFDFEGWKMSNRP